jgi:hypothetical protein
MQKIGVLSSLTLDYVMIDGTTERNIHQELNDNSNLLFMLKDVHGYALAQLDKRNHDAPLRQIPMQGLSSQSTLAEVFNALKAKGEGAVYIYDESTNDILGLISWDMLQSQLFKEDHNAQ